MRAPDDRQRRPDPWSVVSEGLRQLSRLDVGDIRRGFENLAHPSARGMLESLGRTREEQVEKMAAMLRNSSEADIEEMGTVFALAMAKLAEEQARPAAQASDRPRRRRDQTAAEWRRERRAAAS
ncbi:MAG TPA: hypothetical protein VFE55_08850 [Acidimicrobiia bacterium]|nr:hypothetical protein [Acidimicrobiia bacterium]